MLRFTCEVCPVESFEKSSPLFCLRGSLMKIAPIGLKAANEYVATYYRHHKPIRGCKFCVSIEDDHGRCCGVAICGRPVSRYLDNGTTLEINRLCTNGTRNVCSMLYGACVRAAKALG